MRDALGRDDEEGTWSALGTDEVVGTFSLTGASPQSSEMKGSESRGSLELLSAGGYEEQTNYICQILALEVILTRGINCRQRDR